MLVSRLSPVDWARALVFALVLSFATVPAALAHEATFAVAGPISFGEDHGEDALSVQAEIASERVQALRYIGTPSTYAMVSANTGRGTSFAAAGLQWRVRLSRSWSLRPGFGLAVHNGEVHNRFAPGDPRAVEFERTHALLGSRVLFRDTLVVERRLDDTKSIGLAYEHLSNGGRLFGHRENEGLNQIALRFTMKLG